MCWKKIDEECTDWEVIKRQIITFMDYFLNPIHDET